MLKLKVKQVLLDLNERRLFYLFSLIYKDLVDLNINDPMSEVDWFIPSKNVFIEAKCRERHYGGKLFIEKKKYDALLKYENPYYVSSTPEGIWIWNLKNIEPVWEKRKMNKTKLFYNRNKVDKIVAELDINIGKNLTDILITNRLK